VVLIFGLENIPGGLYEFDWVDGLIVDPDLVMDMVTGATPGAAHIRYAIAPRDALPHLHAHTAVVSIKGFEPERMPNLHHAAVSALAPGEGQLLRRCPEALVERPSRVGASRHQILAAHDLPPMNGQMVPGAD
jgi:hypothetical protein